jgi:TonB family protein
MAVEQSQEGINTVVIDVDASGKATAARIFRTSGKSLLDRVATTAALQRTYPKTGRVATYIATYEFRMTPVPVPIVEKTTTP